MKKLVIPVFLLSTFIMGCSAKVEGGSPPPPPDFRPKIEEPFNGSWASDCLNEGSKFTKIKMEFHKREYKRSTSTFLDESCTHLKDSLEITGTFELLFKTPNGYSLKYNEDNSQLYSVGKVLLDENDVLWISASQYGGDLTPTIPLYRVKKDDHNGDNGNDDNPPPQPKPPTPKFPEECLDLNGHYQMNSTYWKVTQTKCEQIEWFSGRYYTDPNARIEIFIPDQIERQISDYGDYQRFRTVYFSGTEKFIFKTRYIPVDDSRAFTTRVEFFFSTRPCNLSNPSGTYLVREVYDDDSDGLTSCDFFKKDQ